jgi:hypothetical protein
MKAPNLRHGPIWPMLLLLLSAASGSAKKRRLYLHGTEANSIGFLGAFPPLHFMHLPFLLLFFLSFMNKSRQRFFPNLPF